MTFDEFESMALEPPRRDEETVFEVTEYDWDIPRNDNETDIARPLTGTGTRSTVVSEAGVRNSAVSRKEISWNS